MIIDAKDLIVGRIATVAAKAALLGEKVDIINCEDAVVSGKKDHIHADTKQRLELGTFKGPFLPRMPDRFVRRVIRGMLPYKQPKGRAAFDRIMCYIGTPAEFAGKETEKLPGAHISKTGTLHYLRIKDITSKIGGEA